MAEAAAMALAVRLISQLGLQHTTILSDNLQLVNFIHGSNHDHPPDWRSKIYTDLIHIWANQPNTTVKRIRRNDNQMADFLAKKANTCNLNTQSALETICTHPSHSVECPIHIALQYVSMQYVTLFTASCCC